MDKFFEKYYLFPATLLEGFLIYFILHFRLKSQGGFKRLLELFSKKRIRVYRLIKLIDKILFNPFMLLFNPIIFFFNRLLPFMGTVWKMRMIIFN